jgi:hypothetical protein
VLVLVMGHGGVVVVPMVPGRSKSGAGEGQQQKGGGKNLLHGSNVARSAPAQGEEGEGRTK